MPIIILLKYISGEVTFQSVPTIIHEIGPSNLCPKETMRVQIRSFSGPYFSVFGLNTDWKFELFTQWIGRLMLSEIKSSFFAGNGFLRITFDFVRE